MSPEFHHADPTTPEVTWTQDTRWDAVAEVRLDRGRGIRRVVVLAAHPDDETLGAAGLIATAADLGIEVRVLIATDGEASHPDSPSHTPAQLAAVRRRESRAAVELLAPGAAAEFLGLPDGAVATHLAPIRTAVEEALADLGVGAVLVAPWRHDGHVDHDALGQLAADIATETGALLLEYPIWLWHWGNPESAPWPAFRRLSLDEALRGRKRAAVQSHRSQVAPLSPAAGDEVLLGEEFLTHFDRPFETFVDTAGAADDHLFERLHRHASDPWDVRRASYEANKRALTLQALPPRTFERAFEPGCSVGALTRELAGRCTTLVAQDLSPTAVAAARRHVTDLAGVEVRLGAVPADWPEGDFDLVVLSEVGYFLSSDELDEVLDRITGSLRPGGVLLLCHWRHPIEGWQLDGRQVHERARLRPGLVSVHQNHTSDFLLDTLETDR